MHVLWSVEQKLLPEPGYSTKRIIVRMEVILAGVKSSIAWEVSMETLTRYFLAKAPSPKTVVTHSPLCHSLRCLPFLSIPHILQPFGRWEPPHGLWNQGDIGGGLKPKALNLKPWDPLKPLHSFLSWWQHKSPKCQVRRGLRRKPVMLQSFGTSKVICRLFSCEPLFLSGVGGRGGSP